MKEMVYQKESDNIVLAQGVYMGYEFAVKSMGTHPTAYVKIPKGYPVHAWDDFDSEIDVHGGITFHSSGGLYIDTAGNKLDGEWIGWDYAHADDAIGYFDDDGRGKKWTTEEMVNHCKGAIRQLYMLADKINRKPE